MELPVLLLVPIAWGTWTPSTVLLYRNISHVPPPPLLNSYFQLVSFAALCTALVVTRRRRRRREQQEENVHEEQHQDGDTTLSPSSVLPSMPSMTTTMASSSSSSSSFASSETGSLSLEPSTSSSSSPTSSSQLLLRAGSELGAWLFVGSSLQLYGLQFTNAAKAPFLVQLTTIFVPVIESILLRRRLSSLTWIACLLGLVGVCVLSSGDFGALFEGLTSVIAPSSTQEILGDACCALSAVFFSIHVVRLGRFASSLPPVSLACVKAGTQVALCTITWAIGALLGYWSASPSLLEPATGTSAAAAAPSAAMLVVLGVVLWNGLVPSAFTVWAQSFGQRVVRPTTANLLYTLQPLWATLFAFVFLHERITLMTYIGGSLIVIASLIAVMTGQFAAEPAVQRGDDDDHDVGGNNDDDGPLVQ